MRQVQAANTLQSQASQNISFLRRLLHWSSALAVLVLVAMGKWISDLELTDLELLRQSLWKFSLHKTPASAVQAYFLCALFVLPVSGLAMHAYAGATAPIWFLPATWLHAAETRPDRVELAVSVHHLVANGLIVAFLLHIGGVLKHQFLDRDQTLRRMWRGRSSTPSPAPTVQAESLRFARQGQCFGLIAAAIAVGVGVYTVGVEQSSVTVLKTPSLSPSTDDTIATSGQPELTEWKSIAEQSKLRIFATQGSDEFEAEFSKFLVVVREDKTGAPVEIDVVIDSASFKSGLNDRDQVVSGGDWLDASAHPTARYRTAEISASDDGSYRAQGELTIRELSTAVPVQFAYTEGGKDEDSTGPRRALGGKASFDRFAVQLGRGEYAAEGAAGKMIAVEFDIQLAPQR